MAFAPTMVKASMLNIFPTLMMLMCRTWERSLLLISLLALPILINEFEDYMYVSFSRVSVQDAAASMQMTSMVSSVVIEVIV